MLDAIKKKLGMNTTAAEATETITSVVDTSAVVSELSVMRTDFEADIAKLMVDIGSAQVALSKMTANFEAAQAALNAVTAEKAEMIVKTEAAKFAARKEKVVLAIGSSEKSEALMLATQDLNDVSFDAVVKALAGSVDAEASSSLFTEVGVSANVDTTKIVGESSVMKLINKKNNKTK